MMKRKSLFQEKKMDLLSLKGGKYEIDRQMDRQMLDAWMYL